MSVKNENKEEDLLNQTNFAKLTLIFDFWKYYRPKEHVKKVASYADSVSCHQWNKKKAELKQLIHEREDIFSNVPSKTNAADHDVDVGDHEAIKQHPYKVKSLKKAHLNNEIEYMLQNNIIEPSKGEWSSPC